MRMPGVEGVKSHDDLVWASLRDTLHHQRDFSLDEMVFSTELARAFEEERAGWRLQRPLGLLFFFRTADRQEEILGIAAD